MNEQSKCKSVPIFFIPSYREKARSMGLGPVYMEAGDPR